MSDDEVNLIYEYLHENYEYCDGEFFHRKKNTKLNGFCVRAARMRATLYINGKNYYIRYSQLVWLYMHKEIFYSFDYRDKNPTNNKIENLIPLTMIEHSFVKRKPSKGFREEILKNGTVKYFAEVFMGTQSFVFGRYDTKEMAIIAYTEAKNLWIKDKKTPCEIKKILIEREIIKIKPKVEKIKKIKKGYSFDKRDGKYYSFHYINNKRIGLGSYKSSEEAHAAYLKAKEEYKNGSISTMTDKVLED